LATSGDDGKLYGATVQKILAVEKGDPLYKDDAEPDERDGNTFVDPDSSAESRELKLLRRIKVLVKFDGYENEEVKTIFDVFPLQNAIQDRDTSKATEKFFARV